MQRAELTVWNDGIANSSPVGYRQMPLTDTALRNAKPHDSAYKLSDCDGLCLLVSTSGSKLRRFDYRFLSKRKILALGQYPIVGRADARRACD